MLLTNQRFCFVVVMPQPVTALAGSDAYLGHQKAKCRRVLFASFSGYPIGCPNFVICLVIDGFSIDRIWANCACDILKYSKNGRRNCAIHARVCGILHGHPWSAVSRAPRHVVGVYFDCGDFGHRQRDKAVNSFAYRCPFPAGLSPSVNATAGGKVPRRAIYRRNTA